MNDECARPPEVGKLTVILCCLPLRCVVPISFKLLLFFLEMVQYNSTCFDSEVFRKFFFRSK
jgi:hypothetical protein